MQTQKTTIPASVFARFDDIGCSATYEENGVTYVFTLEQDFGMPRWEFENYNYNDDAVAAWKNDFWHFGEIACVASFRGACLAVSAQHGVEVGYFEGYREYLAAYAAGLFEETRAQVKAALQTLVEDGNRALQNMDA